jgi:hypothetical protein
MSSVPSVHVASDIADAFGMRGLPGVTVADDFAPRVVSHGERVLSCPRAFCGATFAAWAPVAICPDCGAVAREGARCD